MRQREERAFPTRFALVLQLSRFAVIFCTSESDLELLDVDARLAQMRQKQKKHWRRSVGEALEKCWRSAGDALETWWKGSGELLGIGEALRQWRCGGETVEEFAKTPN